MKVKMTTPATVVLSTLAHLLSQLPVEIKRITIEKLPGEDEYSVALGISLVKEVTKDAEDIIDLGELGDTDGEAQETLLTGTLATVAEQLETTFPKATLPDEVLAYLHNNQKIDAIKELRRIRGCGLKEAKEEIDRYVASIHSGTSIIVNDHNVQVHRVDVPVGQTFDVTSTMYRFANEAEEGEI